MAMYLINYLDGIKQEREQTSNLDTTRDKWNGVANSESKLREQGLLLCEELPSSKYQIEGKTFHLSFITLEAMPAYKLCTQKHSILYKSLQLKLQPKIQYFKQSKKEETKAPVLFTEFQTSLIHCFGRAKTKILRLKKIQSSMCCCRR